MFQRHAGNALKFLRDRRDLRAQRAGIALGGGKARTYGQQDGG